jgi:hypothetical protein
LDFIEFQVVAFETFNTFPMGVVLEAIGDLVSPFAEREVDGRVLQVRIG